MRRASYDIAKCLAIISVILYHVVQRIEENIYIESFINTYFLSIFFFISGYFVNHSYKINKKYIQQKTKSFIIPFVCNAIIYSLIVSLVEYSDVHSVYKIFYQDPKGGFWFLFSLWEFFVCIYFINFIELKTNYYKYFNYFLLIAPFILASFLTIILPDKICGLLSLYSFRRYWIFFAYGYFFRNYLTNVNFTPVIRWGIFLNYIILAALYTLYVRNVHTLLELGFWFIVNFMSIHSILFICTKFENKLSNKTVLYIGRNTMGIYIFQYYPILFFSIMKFDCSSVISCFIYSAICLFISILLVELCKKNQITNKYLLGKS